MRVYYSDHHSVALPPGHRFPMGKYARVRLALREAGVVTADELAPAPAATRADLVRVHAPDYVDAFVEGTLDARRQRAIGLPWSEALVARTLASVGGTLAAARAALAGGFAGNLAGGTHHAHRDAGGGFCVFNDLAVAAGALLAEGAARRVFVLDADVHQGDGTAAIFADEPRVFTCSVHGAKNFPFQKPPSDLDLPLDDGAGDAAYLEAVAEGLAAAETWRPDLLLYQAGVDALAEDTLGRLAVTAAGMQRRDEAVLGWAHRRGVPVVATMGGGYASPIEATIAAHVATYRVARAIFG